MLGVLFYWLCAVLAKALFFALSRLKVIGLENVPSKGPLIVIANHLSVIDPVLLSACFPRRIHFMAKEELFRPFWLRPFVYLYGAFPVHRGQADRRALRRALETLQDGRVLGMFPEGTRSRSIQMQSGLPGTSLVALRSKSLILPVGITGIEKITGLRSLLGRHKIVVNIGKPFNIAPSESKVVEPDLVTLTETVMQRIARLLPENYRGVISLERTEETVLAETGAS